jgi:hypothetical protein
MRRGVEAWEEDARANGREHQIAEVGGYCADIIAQRTARQDDIRRSLDEIKRRKDKE